MYIASKVFHQHVSAAVNRYARYMETEREEVIPVFQEVSNHEFDIRSYIHDNIRKMEVYDKFVVDLSALANADEEIVEALTALLVMYDEKIRIIVLATNRHEGDELLANLFGMGIRNIVLTEDNVELEENLFHCLDKGMTFRDAINFKELANEKLVTKHEVKQKVHKVMIGMAGSQPRIGVTHNSIVLAKYLRKKGFMVALVEMNPSKHYELIREGFDAMLHDNKFFTVDGVDYYQNANDDILSEVVGKSYNFIILDFGPYAECDRIQFNKSDVRICICGGSVWETDEVVNNIFPLAQEIMKDYIYCFNFVPEIDEPDILHGMQDMEHVYFLKYLPECFNSDDFIGADEFLEKYMPVVETDEVKPKKGIFRRKKKEKEVFS